jgi:hypothetical protein
MDTLFSEDPQFRRTQYKKLSDNPREWQQEIGAMVAEKLPKDLGVDVEVVFQQINDEKGYGVGTAIAKDTGTGRQIGVPIIVKAWHLAPLDLFFSDGMLYPISDDNLAKIFYQNSLGTGLAPSKPPPSMTDDVFADTRNPPLGGKYSYSAPFSMLELVSGTLGADDIKALKDAVVKTAGVLSAAHRRGTLDVFQKYADEKPAVTDQDKLNGDRAQAVFTIKKDGPDSYRLYSAPDEVYDPVLVSTNRQGIKSFLAMRKSELCDYQKDPMSVVDQNGEVTIEPPESPYGKPVDGPTGTGGDGSGSYAALLGPRKNPWVFNPLQDDRSVSQIDSFGRYGVRDRDGVIAKGWVVPNVVTFDGGAASMKLFLGKALASYQDRIAGIALPDDDDTNLIPDKMETGKIGTLLYRDGDKVFATVPFQVTGTTVYKNLRSVSIADYKGNLANLIISPVVDGIVELTGKVEPDLKPLLGPKKNYLVSAKMSFIRMPRLCAVSAAPDDFKRVAAEWLDHSPIKVAKANGRYIFRSPRLQKYASHTGGAPAIGPFKKVSFDFSSLARHEAEFLLASWGLGLDKIATVLNGVDRGNIMLEVHHLRLPDLPGPVKQASPELVTFVNQMKAPIGELVKVASVLDDAQSVDSVLSLGFINPENVARFASAKPMLWEVSHMLAKMLLAARLGMDDIPEEAVRSALGQLQRVIDGLGRLKMLEDHKNKDKTASARPPSSAIGGRLVRDLVPVGFAR